MNREQALEWLMVFGRDAVHWQDVNSRFGRENKLTWAYKEHYLKADDTVLEGSGAVYTLTDKALELLKEDDRE